MMREEVSRGSLLSPLTLLAPCATLGSTQLAPVHLALPQQGPESWDPAPSPPLLPPKPFTPCSLPKAENRPRTPKFGA